MVIEERAGGKGDSRVQGLGSWVEGGAVLLGGKEGWDARLGKNAVTVLAPRRMMSWRRSRVSYPWE